MGIKGTEIRRKYLKKLLLRKKKKIYGWKDAYSKEREIYYNRKGWRSMCTKGFKKKWCLLKLKVIIDRERDVQRQKQDSRILIAKYNKRYKELDVIDVSRYLRNENTKKEGQGEGVRALFKLRCNLEEVNKY